MKDVVKRAGADLISLSIFIAARQRYKFLPPPWKIIFIEPYAITESIEPSRYVRKGRYRFSGLVRRSDWDRTIPMPEKHDVLPKFFSEVFFDGRREAPQHLNKDLPERFDELQEEIDIEKYQGLCQSMQADGFEPPGFLFSTRDAFSICIDKGGEFLFTTGKHRLALAKTLGLSKIPVRISARHIQWVRYRVGFYQRLVSNSLNKSDEKFLNHPDLQDLIKRAG